MHKTVQEIAELIGGKVVGDGSTMINGACGIKEAKEGEITFLANSRYKVLLKDTGASAVIIPSDVSVSKEKAAILHENPSLAFAKLMESIGPLPVKYSPGIHPTAIIGRDVKLGKDVSIQAYVVIEDMAEIGDSAIIGAGAFIGSQARVGSFTLVYPRVVIRERIIIGARCIIHSGAVIGSDGFGYATVRGVHHKIPQIGTVVIEDDVEIGANVTIDRARFDKTWIKRGTKIDNLVQIAHNVVIGEDSIIVAQTGISGSTVIGKNVILAGQSGIVGHIKIGDNAIVGAQAGVTKSVHPGTVVLGSPAKLLTRFSKLQALVGRLPKLYDRIIGLEKKMGITGEKNGISEDDC